MARQHMRSERFEAELGFPAVWEVLAQVESVIVQGASSWFGPDANIHYLRSAYDEHGSVSGDSMQEMQDEIERSDGTPQRIWLLLEERRLDRDWHKIELGWSTGIAQTAFRLEVKGPDEVKVSGLFDTLSRELTRAIQKATPPPPPTAPEPSPSATTPTSPSATMPWYNHPWIITIVGGIIVGLILWLILGVT